MDRNARTLPGPPLVVDLRTRTRAGLHRQALAWLADVLRHGLPATALCAEAQAAGARRDVAFLAGDNGRLELLRTVEVPRSAHRFELKSILDSDDVIYATTHYETHPGTEDARVKVVGMSDTLAWDESELAPYGAEADSKRNATRALIEGADVLVTPSLEMRRRLQAVAPGFSGSSVEQRPYLRCPAPVVPAGDRPEGPLCLLRVGRIRPHKGARLLFGILDELSGLADDERRPQIRLAGVEEEIGTAITSRYGSLVSVLPHLPISELIAEYRRAAAVFSTSLIEGFEFGVADALVVDVPILVHRRPPCLDGIQQAAVRFGDASGFVATLMGDAALPRPSQAVPDVDAFLGARRGDFARDVLPVALEAFEDR